jgi:hypothetical protein
MDKTELEKRIAAQRFQPLPGAWREAILEQACLAGQQQHAASERGADHPPSSPRARRSQLAALAVALLGFARPTRQGWAGLAAAWALILLLNHLAERPGPGDPAMAQPDYARMAAAYYARPAYAPEPALHDPNHSPGPRSQSTAGPRPT